MPYLSHQFDDVGTVNSGSRFYGYWSAPEVSIPGTTLAGKRAGHEVRSFH